MKKIFLFAAIALMASVGLNARNAHRAPMNNQSNYECQWDSTYFFKENAAWAEKEILQERDTANNSMLIYRYEWKKLYQEWKPLSVSKYVYDDQGRLSLELSCEVESFDDYVFNDSTVYTYGDQEITEIEYFDDGNVTYVNDSIHYTLDAKGNVIEKAETEFIATGEVGSREKEVFTYDSASNLVLTDTTFRYRNERWDISKSRIYTIENGHYTSCNEMLEGDTLPKYHYYYHYSGDQLTEIFAEERKDGTWTEHFVESRLYTYNNCGEQMSEDVYVYNEDSAKLVYQEGEHKFFTEKKIVSVITKDVVVDSATSYYVDPYGTIRFQGNTSDSTELCLAILLSEDGLIKAGTFPDSAVVLKSQSYVKEKGDVIYTFLQKVLSDLVITIRDDKDDPYYNAKCTAMSLDSETGDTLIFNIDITYHTPREANSHEAVTGAFTRDSSNLRSITLWGQDSVYKYKFYTSDTTYHFGDTLKLGGRKSPSLQVFAATDTVCKYQTRLYFYFNGWVIVNLDENGIYTVIGEVLCQENMKFYINCKKPSAVENVAADQKKQGTKFLQDGQLYIRRGEVIYDAKGMRVK